MWMNLKACTLQKQYKEKLSDFREWLKKTDTESLVYPENFGENMSLDETCLHNGEFYTVLTNKSAKGRKGSLAALIKGTKCEVVSKALAKVPIETRMKVKTITVDLANNMDWICRNNFMNATIVADRFHVQKVVSEAVQQIRIKERWRAIDEENELISQSRKEKVRYKPFCYANGDTKKQLLSRGRYLLFMPQSKWTDSQKERAKILFENFPEIKKAYELSMCFRGVFESAKDREEARKRLEKWGQMAIDSKLKPLISAAKTVSSHSGEILNYFDDRQTNASAESFNSKLKEFRALVRGIRDMNFFLFRIEKIYS